MVKPLSPTAQSLWPGWIGSLLFVAATGVAFLAFGVRPLVAIQGARTWAPQSCTVMSSAIAPLNNRKYSVKVSYAWQRDGRAFSGERYDFTGQSMDEGGDWQQMRDSLSPGRTITCYVDPQHPEEAVIERESWTAAIASLAVCAIFLLVALGTLALMIAGTVSVGQRARPVTSGGVPPAEAPAPLTLLQTRKSRLVASSIMAIAFNLFALGKGVGLVERWRTGQRDWGLVTVITVSVTAGLWLAVRAAKTLMTPQIRLIGAPARLGEPLVVCWELTAQSTRVQTVTATLVGRELAIFHGGSKFGGGQRDRIFVELPMASSEPGRNGTARVELPRETVPSLAAPFSAILWSVSIHVRIHHRPDVNEQFQVTLLPAAGARS